MAESGYPKRYLDFNNQLKKDLNLVIKIEGVNELFSLVPVYKRVNFGADKIKFGDPGLVFGGLIPDPRGRAWIQDSQGLALSQKIEPESGKSSVSLLTIPILDKDGYFTRLCAPGVKVDEILGNREVKAYIGHKMTAFPEDYYVAFRATISNTAHSAGGTALLKLSDPNRRRRQTICYDEKTHTTGVVEYRSITIRGIEYRSDNIDCVSIQFVDTGAGTTHVAVVGSAIIIYIKPGQTTGQEVVDIVQASPAAMALLTSVSLNENLWQYIQPAVELGKSALISVNDNSGFHRYVIGPDGSYDYQADPEDDSIEATASGSATCYIKVEDEWMEYGPDGVSDGSFTVRRGGAYSRGTVPAIHAIDAEVVHGIQLVGNAFDLALKIQLSGWGGPWKTDLTCSWLGADAISKTSYSEKNVIRLNANTDAKDDLGLVVGDFLTISGSANPANNRTVVVTQIRDFDRPNQLIYVDADLETDSETDNVRISVRSKYDTLPTTAGLKLRPTEVDVERHEWLRDNFFWGDENRLRLFISEETTGKDYIETEIFKAVGAYSLTRYGRLSVGFHRVPTIDSKLVILDADCVLNPADHPIWVDRGTESRRFYTGIEYRYDYDDDTGEFATTYFDEDLDAVGLTGGSNPLVIESKGLKSGLGAAVLVARRAANLLTRYSRAPYEVSLMTNWKGGAKIEAGDIILLKDEGRLKIPNLETGERNLGMALLEVVDRNADLKVANFSLKLQGGIALNLTDRYGTFSPASLIESGTRTTLKLKASSDLNDDAEWSKWSDYIGLPILVHDDAFTRSAEIRLAGFDPRDPYTLILGGSLPFDPQPDDVIDIGDYPEAADPSINRLYKLVHAFWMPQLVVVSGINQRTFTTSEEDAAKFVVGLPIQLHTDEFDPLGLGLGELSKEVKVAEISGTTIRLEKDLGFVPSEGMLIELVGFKDGGGPYRWT